jgi:hypothetical protein
MTRRKSSAGIARLAGHFTRTKRRYAVAIIAFISVAYALLFAFKVPRIPFVADINIDRVELKVHGVNNETPVLNIPAGYLVTNVEGASRVNLMGRADRSAGAPFNIVLSPGQTAIAAIEVPDGSTLAIETYVAQGIAVVLRPPEGKPATIQLVLQHGNLTVTDRTGSEEVLAVAADDLAISVVTIDPAAGALILHFVPPEPQTSCDVEKKTAFVTPNMAGIRIGDLRFVRTTDTATAASASTVLSGNIRFPGVGRDNPLFRGESVQLDAEEAEVSSLRILPCYITIEVQGLGNYVGLGQRSSLEDVRPTYLEVAARDRNITFAVSIVLSMWGFLWGLRELLVKSESKK